MLRPTAAAAVAAAAAAAAPASGAGGWGLVPHQVVRGLVDLGVFVVLLFGWFCCLMCCVVCGFVVFRGSVAGCVSLLWFCCLMCFIVCGFVVFVAWLIDMLC